MAVEIVGIVLGVVLAVFLSACAILLLRATQSAEYRSLLFGGLRTISIAVIVMVLGFLALVSLAFMPLGLFWFAIFIYVAIEVYRKIRASRQYALLWLLTVSAEREAPLTAALEAFARERSGGFAWKARRLAALLDSGVSLPEGLERVPGLLPPHALPLIRVGCQSGAFGRGASPGGRVERSARVALDGVERKDRLSGVSGHIRVFHNDVCLVCGSCPDSRKYFWILARPCRTTQDC